MTTRTLAAPLIALVALVAAVSGFVGTATAATEYINIPAVAFPLAGNTSYLENVGAIQATDAAVVRTAVYFKTQGLNICRLSVWAHDTDGNDVTARLIRKRIAPDGTDFGVDPETIATVSTAGAENPLRLFSSTAISAPAVAPSFFYWVELEWPTATFIEVTGVRVFTSTTCP